MSFLESVSGGYSRAFWSCWPSPSLFIDQQSGCGAETHRISGAAINQLIPTAFRSESLAISLSMSGGFEGCLEVLGEAAVAADPGEEALDDPAPGLDGEADLVGVLANDLDGDGGGAGNPLPGVAAVGKDLRDEGKGVARGRQHGPAAVAVLDVGRVRLQHQGTTVGVDEGVALSALDLLAGVVAPRPAGLRRL